MNKQLFGTPNGSPAAALILALVTWVPLLILTSIEGLALSGAPIPFLHDLSSHARFLIAVPVLVLADRPVAMRLEEIVSYFLKSKLVRESDRKAFSQSLDSLRSLMLSRRADIVIMILALAGGWAATSQLKDADFWFDVRGEFSMARFYYRVIALPAFFFLLFRWLFRIVVWTKCLFVIAMMDLFLTPAHPDGAGGLGILGRGTIPFGYVLFALNFVVSGAIASRILYRGAELQHFGFSFAVLMVLSLLILAAPVLVFVPKLVRLKQEGLFRYGILASHYTQMFDRRWSESRSSRDDLLGSADIQSLADLNSVCESVRKMRIIPLELKDFVALGLMGIAPVLPLALLVMPLSEILKGILRLVG
jgi:hypothetical protein